MDPVTINAHADHLVARHGSLDRAIILTEETLWAPGDMLPDDRTFLRRVLAVLYDRTTTAAPVRR